MYCSTVVLDYIRFLLGVPNKLAIEYIVLQHRHCIKHMNSLIVQSRREINGIKTHGPISVF